MNLCYRDPRSIDVDEWLARKDDDLFVILHLMVAGRLRWES